MIGTRLRNQIGMVLIEAMVALVVLAAGVLGIAKLSAYLMDINGQAKARTQAVQLAETKLAELRSLMVKEQFTAITALAQNSAETLYGYSGNNVQSTQFRRWWTVANSGTEGRAVEVFVSWTDRTNAAQQVVVRSVVSWDDPASAVAVVKGTSGAGSYVSSPTGRAKLGGDGPITIPPGSTPGSDGLYKLQGDDGHWRLADASGNVLLTATTAGEELSQIEGNVYIDQANLRSLGNATVYVVISDASFCSMTPAKNQALANFDSGTVYKYFSYICYVGANWYGNIGVVRTDNANTNDRVCVGDPTVTAISYSTKTDNRHPALSTIRMYRGYSGTSPTYQSTGIGVQAGAYTGARYNGHDFLLTRISGQPADADCSAKLQLYDNAAPYQPFGTCATGGGCPNESYDATVHTPATETAYLYGGNTVVLGNPGKFFCFTASCPESVSLEPPTPITINITGTVAQRPTNGQTPTILSMVTNSGTCTPPTFSGNGATSNNYSCAFTGVGFTGGTWTGSITVTVDSGQYICSTDVTGTASPLPAAPTSPVQNSYTFEFTNQSVNAGNSTLNFKIGKTAADCST
ncbi:MAG TPA: hypothetical protein VJ673_08290 [Aromatoleum sp.]|uniref:type IV pilus modification PilV family protein n=1 Tax=Aromatoleum sp. TaxID=2307007 RepID=UPI002B46F5FF|nr:hypothetical protein [Aromatoleum sp.]HJV25672.1 hypothetical protein [Aromatoleum sp.]